MKRMISTLVVITLVLLLSQPTWAAGNDSTQKERLKKAREANKETEIRSTVTVDVGKLDISGIRLGMTPDEVRAAIEKAYPNSKIDVRETSARHRSYTGKTLDCTSEGIRIKVSFAYNGPRNLDRVICYTWERKRGGPSGEFEEAASAVV